MSLFRQLKRALEAPPAQRDPDPKLSVAVLLVEAARQDDTFDATERRRSKMRGKPAAGTGDSI